MIKEKLAKLINVKSVVTIILTIIFAVLALRGTITGSEFLTVFTTIIAFYYGTQTEKKSTTQAEEKSTAQSETRNI